MTSADPGPLVADFAARHPDIFAAEISSGSVEEIVSLVSKLPVDARIDVLARLPGSKVDDVIAAIPDFAGEWLSPAPVDKVSELLSRLPRNRRLTLLEGIASPEKRRRLMRQQQFPAHTIGNLIVDVPIRIVETAKSADIARAVRELGNRDPGLLVVISKDGDYRGALDPWPLLTAAKATRLGDFIIDVKPLLPEMSALDVADDERWNDFAWLPVVDHEGQVLGRVARSRVLKAARDQALESLHRQDFVTSLFAEFVHLCGGILERLLSGPARS